MVPQIDKDLEQLAEALGMKTYTMKVNGGAAEITLRPLSLAAQVELNKADFADQAEATARALYLSAKRGGFEGTQEEFSELLEGDEILEASEALAKLAPLSAREGRRILGLPEPGAEAGTAPSGDSSSSASPSAT